MKKYIRQQIGHMIMTHSWSLILVTEIFRLFAEATSPLQES